MNKIDLIKIPAYEFQAEDDLVNELLDEVSKLEYYKNTNNETSLMHYHNLNMFKWFNLCINTIKNQFFKKEINLEIVDCWVNKNTKLQGHHKHFHTNSIISGIFYLNNHDSETKFYFKNPWVHLHDTGFLDICPSSANAYTCINSIKPTKGKLILFPSQIEHSVGGNKSNDVRYTVSFNTFVSGRISSNISAYLEIPSFDNSHFGKSIK